MGSKEVIINYPQERFISLMCESQIGDFEESGWVAHAVLKNLKNSSDLIPSVAFHSGFDLASKCLVCLGFFPEYMKHLTDKHGYPSPEFYASVGKNIFIQEGRKDISTHFENWTGFFHERFKVELKKQEGIITPIVYERVREHTVYSDHRQWKHPGQLQSRYKLGDLCKNSPN